MCISVSYIMFGLSFLSMDISLIQANIQFIYSSTSRIMTSRTLEYTIYIQFNQQNHDKYKTGIYTVQPAESWQVEHWISLLLLKSRAADLRHFIVISYLLGYQIIMNFVFKVQFLFKHWYWLVLLYINFKNVDVEVCP